MLDIIALSFELFQSLLELRMSEVRVLGVDHACMYTSHSIQQCQHHSAMRNKLQIFLKLSATVELSCSKTGNDGQHIIE